jgi:exonuclease III
LIEGLGIKDIDDEGRYLECQFGNLSVVSLYLPSGSSGEERQTFKFSVMARFMPHLTSDLKPVGEMWSCVAIGILRIKKLI